MSTFNQTGHACARVRRTLDAYVSRELDGARGRQVRRHLDDCPACSALTEECVRVRALVRRAVRGEPAPASLRVKVREIIRKAAE